MAENKWISNVPEYWANATNWSLGRIPAYGDDVVFDGNGVGSCTLSDDVSMRSLKVLYGFPSLGIIDVPPGNLNIVRIGQTSQNGRAIDVYSGFVFSSANGGGYWWRIYGNFLPDNSVVEVTSFSVGGPRGFRWYLV